MIKADSGTQRLSADSLIGRACQGLARALYGVQATIQPLHTLVNGPKLPHTDALQLQELALVARQHEGLDSSSLPEKQTEGLVWEKKIKRISERRNSRHRRSVSSEGIAASPNMVALPRGKGLTDLFFWRCL